MQAQARAPVPFVRLAYLYGGRNLVVNIRAQICCSDPLTEYPMRVLLIEDDRAAADYIARGLTEQGHVCDVLADGTDGLFQATREDYDLSLIHI